MKQHEQLKDLMIARAEEAAKYYGLKFMWFKNGIWVRFQGYKEGLSSLFQQPEVEVKARGWKNASDAFVAAATAWSQKNKGSTMRDMHTKQIIAIVCPKCKTEARNVQEKDGSIGGVFTVTGAGEGVVGLGCPKCKTEFAILDTELESEGGC